MVDSEAIPPQEDSSAERATEELEALHRTPSGPAYSVFSSRQRQFIVLMVACAGFFSPLSANIYFLALNALSADLKVSNELINLSLTSFMIFQGLAPTVFGDLADMTGRKADLHSRLYNIHWCERGTRFTKQLRCSSCPTVSAKYWKQRYRGFG